ncbi:MAG: type I restriction enzyme HsdR N-terminal domain-containing protein [Candidatus Latescibacteria bacterium]|jgi:hypothetical protein|nr:type I restriction enzyme HsdR N-terminal domain-containing protein [Candidatus Latescibacterota bacterium]MBT5832407.1 type I restriction enzyme HsdR N-terminal domain-containing protein [Candidatus Latescibacterota bacterium]
MPEQLNFPTAFNFDIVVREGREMILDTLRQKYVVITPEEWVRQNFVRYLIESLGYPQGRTAIETGFIFQGMQCRADVLVYDKQGKALLMGECKAPEIKLKQTVFDQIGRYNTVVQADYLVATNGLQHYCCQIDREKNTYQFLDAVPQYSEIV